MVNPNNAFPFLDENGQVVLGNATLRVILADADRLLTRNIWDRRAIVASNDRYMDRLSRMIQFGDSVKRR